MLKIISLVMSNSTSFVDHFFCEAEKGKSLLKETFSASQKKEKSLRRRDHGLYFAFSLEE